MGRGRIGFKTVIKQATDKVCTYGLYPDLKATVSDKDKYTIVLKLQKDSKTKISYKTYSINELDCYDTVWDGHPLTIELYSDEPVSLWWINRIIIEAYHAVEDILIKLHEKYAEIDSQKPDYFETRWDILDPVKDIWKLVTVDKTS